ncbi:MAG: hypothetical protein AAF514_24410, partial [Verrucomicrobiota bacterium]
LTTRKLTWSFNHTLFALYLLFMFQDIIILNMDRFNIPLGVLFKKADEGVILLTAVLVCYRRLLLRKAIRLHFILLFPVLLALWSVASMLANEVPHGIAALDTFLLIKGFLVFVIALNADFGPRTVRKFVKAHIGITLVVCGIEFVQVPFPAVAEAVFGVEPMYRSGSVRPTGPFEHPGTLGTFLGFQL